MNQYEILDVAKSVLLNKKITEVRFLTDIEKEMLGWEKKSIVFILEDNTTCFITSNNDGNEAGTLFYNDDGIIPNI